MLGYARRLFLRRVPYLGDSTDETAPTLSRSLTGRIHPERLISIHHRYPLEDVPGGLFAFVLIGAQWSGTNCCLEWHSMRWIAGGDLVRHGYEENDKYWLFPDLHLLTQTVSAEILSSS